MNVFMYVYSIYVCVCLYTMCVCIYVYMYVYIYECIYLCIYIRVYVCMHVCTIYVCMYVCMYVSLYTVETVRKGIQEFIKVRRRRIKNTYFDLQCTSLTNDQPQLYILFVFSFTLFYCFLYLHFISVHSFLIFL